MIISKSNLMCQLITKHDKIPVLNNVVIEPDGSSVGSNGKSLMLVSPVSDKVKKSFPIKEDGDTERLIFGEETAKEVMKNIPRDTKFKGLLEHCDVREDPDNEEQVNFSITDGKRTRYIIGRRWMRKFIDYLSMLRNFRKTKTEVRVVLNRRRLMALLEALDKACPDSSGFSPVYIEFSKDNDVLLRAENHANGQRALGLMSSYKGVEESWLEENEWERRLYDADNSDNGSVDSGAKSSSGVSRSNGNERPQTKSRKIRKIPKKVR